MHPHQHTYLANTVREHREWLEDMLVAVAERGQPLTELEARLIADVGAARLAHVEDTLRYHAARRGPRKILAWARGWTRPRIGMLWQYHPKPLLVPAAYVHAAPPDPPPTISIVTPSFEQGRFLGRTIDSVVGQRYPALEYVVQDGGSSDESVDVMRRYETALTRWVSEPDGGQADAVNRGFQGTTGEIMGWLNSDDLLLPGSLAYVACYFANNPNVDVVYGNRLMIDENDMQVGAWVLPAHDDDVLTYADYVPQETLFWRRTLWDSVGGALDPSFRYALDWDLLLRFREVGATMVRLPRFLGAFRIHELQKTTAASDIGDVECARLRRRVHGRDIPPAEMRKRMRPFFLRHILVHKRQRILDRLPVSRFVVQTVPKVAMSTQPDIQSQSPELRVPERRPH